MARSHPDRRLIVTAMAALVAASIIAGCTADGPTGSGPAPTGSSSTGVTPAPSGPTPSGPTPSGPAPSGPASSGPAGSPPATPGPGPQPGPTGPTDDVPIDPIQRTLIGTVARTGGCTVLLVGSRRWPLTGDRAAMLAVGDRLMVVGNLTTVPANCSGETAPALNVTSASPA